MALGYEDIIDHDELRHDPVFLLLSQKLKPGRADYALLAGKTIRPVGVPVSKNAPIAQNQTKYSSQDLIE
jgi:hypothetical protein